MEGQRLEPGGGGVSRRDFIKVCSAAAAAVGLPAWAAEKMAEDAGGKKPSVVWLHLQECTGCTESLLRTSHPDVASLILDLVSHQNLPIEMPTAPMAYPAIHPDHDVVGRSAAAVGVGGAVVGVLAAAGVAVSRKLAADDAGKAEGKE